MKTLLFTLFLTLSFLSISQASFAETDRKLYVVNSGSSTGTFNAITRAYTDDLKKYYNKIEYVHARGCSKASSIVPRLDGPTFLIWDGPMYSLYLDGDHDSCPMKITKETFVRADLKYARIMVKSSSNLTLNDFLSDRQSWKVGHDVPVLIWERFLDELSDYRKSKYISVPYESSGVSSLGLLSGEIDFLIVNSKQAIKFEYQGQMKTLATFNPAGLKNRPDIPSVSSKVDFELARAGRSEFLLILNATKEEREKLKKIIKKIHNDSNTNIVKWYKTSGFQDSLDLGDEEGFKQAMELVEIWRKKQ